MMNDFISLVRAEAIRVASQHDALVAERQELMRKMVKVSREIDILNSLIKYHEEEVRDENRTRRKAG